jgi:hypothetical protein
MVIAGIPSDQLRHTRSEADATTTRIQAQPLERLKTWPRPCFASPARPIELPWRNDALACGDPGGRPR